MNMWCCDVCSADAQTFDIKNSAGELFHLCRRCRAKLQLSLPMNPTPAELDKKLNEMVNPPAPTPKYPKQQNISSSFHNHRPNARRKLRQGAY